MTASPFVLKNGKTCTEQAVAQLGGSTDVAELRITINGWTQQLLLHKLDVANKEAVTPSLFENYFADRSVPLNSPVRTRFADTVARSVPLTARIDALSLRWSLSIGGNQSLAVPNFDLLHNLCLEDVHPGSVYFTVCWAAVNGVRLGASAFDENHALSAMERFETAFSRAGGDPNLLHHVGYGAVSVLRGRNLDSSYVSSFDLSGVAKGFVAPGRTVILGPSDILGVYPIYVYPAVSKCDIVSVGTVCQPCTHAYGWQLTETDAGAGTIRDAAGAALTGRQFFRSKCYVDGKDGTTYNPSSPLSASLENWITVKVPKFALSASARDFVTERLSKTDYGSTIMFAKPVKDVSRPERPLANNTGPEASFFGRIFVDAKDRSSVGTQSVLESTWLLAIPRVVTEVLFTSPVYSFADKTSGRPPVLTVQDSTLRYSILYQALRDFATQMSENTSLSASDREGFKNFVTKSADKADAVIKTTVYSAARSAPSKSEIDSTWIVTAARSEGKSTDAIEGGDSLETLVSRLLKKHDKGAAFLSYSVAHDELAESIELASAGVQAVLHVAELYSVYHGQAGFSYVKGGLQIEIDVSDAAMLIASGANANEGVMQALEDAGYTQDVITDLACFKPTVAPVGSASVDSQYSPVKSSMSISDFLDNRGYPRGRYDSSDAYVRACLLFKSAGFDLADFANASFFVNAL